MHMFRYSVAWAGLSYVIRSNKYILRFVSQAFHDSIDIRNPKPTKDKLK